MGAPQGKGKTFSYKKTRTGAKCSGAMHNYRIFSPLRTASTSLSPL